MTLRPDEWQALILSLKVSFWATVLTLPLALAVAWLLARREFPGKAVLSALVHLPLVLPPVVVGYLLLLTFGRQGAIGGFLEEIGIVLAFRWTGAALAAGVMGFPLMVRAIRLAFEAVDPRLAAAAETLGAGRAEGAIRLLVLSVVVAVGAVLVSEWLARRVARRIGRP